MSLFWPLEAHLSLPVAQHSWGSSLTRDGLCWGPFLALPRGVGIFTAFFPAVGGDVPCPRASVLPEVRSLLLGCPGPGRQEAHGRCGHIHTRAWPPASGALRGRAVLELLLLRAPLTQQRGSRLGPPFRLCRAASSSPGSSYFLPGGGRGHSWPRAALHTSLEYGRWPPSCPSSRHLGLPVHNQISHD